MLPVTAWRESCERINFMNEKTPQRTVFLALPAALAVLLAPGAAFAHVGVNPVHDLLHGLEHPLTGLDHICAMFAVGLWAAQRGGRAIWSLPLAFLLVMTVGSVLGIAGIILPFVEQQIVLSVILLGVLIAAALRLPMPISILTVGLFALAHGNAHGAELQASAAAVPYVLGFLTSTALLHAAGIAFGLAMRRAQATQFVHLAGVTIAACGLYLSIH
jgi:urease accessory protein